MILEGDETRIIKICLCLALGFHEVEKGQTARTLLKSEGHLNTLLQRKAKERY